MKKMLLIRVALFGLFLFLTKGLSAQNVGINDDNSIPDPNAMLDVKSSSKGVLFPRMTTAQRTVLGTANPTEGMLVFDTDEKAYFFFVGGAWVELTAGGTSGGTVPVGTILAYAKDTLDNGGAMEVIPGYLLCNGAVINVNNDSKFQNLKSTIQEYWGDGNDQLTYTFNLPDLRGMFLRGVSGVRSDGKQETIADINTRQKMLSPPFGDGGNTGNKVGSYQEDAFQNHSHGYTKHQTTIDRGSSGGQAAVLRNHTDVESGLANGNAGAETRPRNAYVHYIIKY